MDNKQSELSTNLLTEKSSLQDIPSTDKYSTLVEMVEKCDIIGKKLNDFNVLDQTQFYNEINEYIDLLKKADKEIELFPDVNINLDIINFVENHGNPDDYIALLTKDYRILHETLKKQIFSTNRFHNNLIHSLNEKNKEFLTKYYNLKTNNN